MTSDDDYNQEVTIQFDLDDKIEPYKMTIKDRLLTMGEVVDNARESRGLKPRSKDASIYLIKHWKYGDELPTGGDGEWEIISKEDLEKKIGI